MNEERYNNLIKGLLEIAEDYGAVLTSDKNIFQNDSQNKIAISVLDENNELEHWYMVNVSDIEVANNIFKILKNKWLLIPRIYNCDGRMIME